MFILIILFKIVLNRTHQEKSVYSVLLSVIDTPRFIIPKHGIPSNTTYMYYLESFIGTFLKYMYHECKKSLSIMMMLKPILVPRQFL